MIIDQKSDCFCVLWKCLRCCCNIYKDVRFILWKYLDFSAFETIWNYQSIYCLSWCGLKMCDITLRPYLLTSLVMYLDRWNSSKNIPIMQSYLFDERLIGFIFNLWIVDKSRHLRTFRLTDTSNTQFTHEATHDVIENMINMWSKVIVVVCCPSCLHTCQTWHLKNRKDFKTKVQFRRLPEAFLKNENRWTIIAHIDIMEYTHLSFKSEFNILSLSSFLCSSHSVRCSSTAAYIQHRGCKKLWWLKRETMWPFVMNWVNRRVGTLRGNSEQTGSCWESVECWPVWLLPV